MGHFETFMTKGGNQVLVNMESVCYIEHQPAVPNSGATLVFVDGWYIEVEGDGAGIVRRDKECPCPTCGTPCPECSRDLWAAT